LLVRSWSLLGEFSRCNVKFWGISEKQIHCIHINLCSDSNYQSTDCLSEIMFLKYELLISVNVHIRQLLFVMSTWYCLILQLLAFWGNISKYISYVLSSTKDVYFENIASLNDKLQSIWMINRTCLHYNARTTGGIVPKALIRGQTVISVKMWKIVFSISQNVHTP
jgi:hypothetical protein